MVIDAVEDLTCRLNRQRGDDWTSAVGRNGENPGGDAKADVVEPTQLLDHGVYLARVGSLRVENRFGIIEE